MIKGLNETVRNLDLITTQTIVSRDIEKLINLARHNILNRVKNKNQDVNGKAFTPYSKAYARKKRVSRERVDLTLSGKMFNQLKTKAISGNEGRLFFGSARAKKLANIHNNLGVGRSKVLREFFGLSDEDKKELIATAKTLMGYNLRRLK
jgi:hypothetical protein